MPRLTMRSLLAGLALVGAVIAWGGDALRRLEVGTPSVCFGNAADGRLERGKRLPVAGPNFAAASRLGGLLGRNAVHGTVRDVVVDAYATMARSRPGTRFLYGDTGWPSGGRIRPHATHRNGTSVDFLVPVRDARGRPGRLPAWPFTLWGYLWRVDARGRVVGLGWEARGRPPRPALDVAPDLRVDFDTLGEHLLALEAASRARGTRIHQVILDTPLLARVFGSARGKDVQRVLGGRFDGDAWVRHDEHYHVDFGVRCAPGR